MEYQVPQFIEVEDKIFGPLTFKQFIYLAGGAGLCAVLFYLLPLILAILFSIPVAALAGALAFYRINNKPFISVVEAALGYVTSSKLYLWRKGDREAPPRAPRPRQSAPVALAKLSRSKLRDLAWSLDIKDRI